MLKKLLIVLVLVILLVVGVVIFAVSKIDVIVKKLIEEGGTNALGVKTTVTEVDLSIRAGTFDMTGLTIANPGGFDRDYFVKLDSAGTKIDIKSLSSNLVEVPSLTFSGIDVNLQKDGAKSNFQTILNTVSAKNGGGDETNKEAKPADPNAKKFVIREVVVKDVNIHAKVASGVGELDALAGSMNEIDIPIDEIRLENVGNAEGGGVPMEELTQILVQALLEAVKEKAGDSLPGGMLGDLQSSLAKLGSLDELGLEMAVEVGAEAQKAIDEAKSELEGAIGGAKGDAEKAIEDAKKGLEKGIGKEIEKGLGGLLGGGNKDGG